MCIVLEMTYKLQVHFKRNNSEVALVPFELEMTYKLKIHFKMNNSEVELMIEIIMSIWFSWLFLSNMPVTELHQIVLNLKTGIKVN